MFLYVFTGVRCPIINCLADCHGLGCIKDDRGCDICRPSPCLVRFIIHPKRKSFVLCSPTSNSYCDALMQLTKISKDTSCYLTNK